MADHSSDFTARAHINVAKKKKRKPTWRSSFCVSYESRKIGPKVLNPPSALLYKGAHNFKGYPSFLLVNSSEEKIYFKSVAEGKQVKLGWQYWV